jgi:hypothetical protein
MTSSCFPFRQLLPYISASEVFAEYESSAEIIYQQVFYKPQMLA